MRLYGMNPLLTTHLQATLAAQTAHKSLDDGIEGTQVHHPISCGSVLNLFEDGSMTCDHARATPDNLRTQSALNASVAILIMELLSDFHEGKLQLQIGKAP